MSEATKKYYEEQFPNAIQKLLMGDKPEQSNIIDDVIYIEELLNKQSNLMSEYPDIKCSSTLKFPENKFKTIKKTFLNSDNHQVFIWGNCFTVRKFLKDEFNAASEIDIMEEKNEDK